MTDLDAKAIEKLRLKSTEAQQLSYSPYSKFAVGAAILMEDGEYVLGANVENASYGACICAEQVAVTKSITSGYKRFKALGVCTDLKEPASPCGICRQVLREFAPELPIYMFSSNGDKCFKMTLKELLPHSFGPDQLKEYGNITA
ncbi:hypothetical protein CANCADRAFT_57364 [Tortispora caseinolytica NRRL Y-17796]|uniref:Cytidine deaminase n=1 Tax=Tortispora caseinolytica NRRL Y-17796 TaxID=767744 RepID=A0A1E4TGY5_9ASCO|nr:hypothetical protein CANCADRAFT_57364 [Tortispora caseinolytica NRRL Y-17796]